MARKYIHNMRSKNEQTEKYICKHDKLKINNPHYVSS